MTNYNLTANLPVEGKGLLPVALSIGSPVGTQPALIGLNGKSSLSDTPPSNQWVFTGSLYGNSVAFLTELYWELVQASILQNNASLSGQLVTKAAAQVQAQAAYQEGQDNKQKDLLQMGSDIDAAATSGISAVATGVQNVNFDRQTITHSDAITLNKAYITKYENLSSGKVVGGNGAALPEGNTISEGQQAQILNQIRAENFTAVDEATYRSMNFKQRQEVIEQLNKNIETHNRDINTISNNKSANATQNNVMSQTVQSMVKAIMDGCTASVDADLGVQRAIESVFQALVQLSEQWSGSSNSQRDRYLGNADSVAQVLQHMGDYLYKG